MRNIILLKYIFEEFNKNRIPYCVLRSYEKLPEEIGQDIDIINDKKFNLLIEKIVLEGAKKFGFDMWIKKSSIGGARQYICQRFENKNFIRLALDFRNDLEERGVVYFEGKKIIDLRRPLKDFYIISPEIELLHILIRAAYGPQKNLSKYIKKLEELSEKSDYFYLKQSLPFPISFFVFKAISGKKIRTSVYLLKLSWLFFLIKNKALKNKIKEGIFRNLRRVFNQIRPPGLFVVIAGPDGVGKSTACILTKNFLSQRYFKIKHFHFGFRPGLLPTHKKIGFSLPRKKNNFFDFLRFLYHFVDYWFGYLFKIRPVVVRSGIVLVERYFYDYLLPGKEKGVVVKNKIIKFFLFFLPKPDIFVLLFNKPKIIRKRSKDLTENQIKRHIEILEEEGKKTKRFLKISTNKPKDVLVKELAEKLIEKAEL